MSMESHLLASCAMPDWAILFTQTMDPCRPHWTVIPYDLALKMPMMLEPFEFTVYTDPSFDWFCVLKLLNIDILFLPWLFYVWCCFISYQAW
jgi:hypothetical protein